MLSQYFMKHGYHTAGICPETTGAPNDGKWEYILGHSGDKRTARLAFDPGAGCGSGFGVQITGANVNGDGCPDILTASKLGTFLFLNQAR